MADSLHLARIPAGEFLMGTPDAELDERPVHRVHVGEFFIGRHPVTQDDYARFVRSTGHPAPAIRVLPLITGNGREEEFRRMAEPYVWDASGRPPTGHGPHPVVLVGFDDAVAFCRWMSEQEDRFVRLPTEAEWEKAARGGADGQRFPWGDDIDPSKAHFLVDPSVKARRGTRPTGTFPPNAYGLYDVAGNVWEWVADWYAEDYYSISATVDPRGPERGTFRIVRGGSWVNADVNMLRCAYRHKVPPDTYAHSIGFRVVYEP